MANLHNRNPNNRDENLNPTPPLNHYPERDPNRAVAYRDGYVHGRVSERDIQEEGLEVRDNNNAARGLLVGIALTSLVGLGLGALFFWTQREEPTPTIIVPQEQPASPSPQVQQPQQTIIERQVEQVPVPVPQQQAPAPQQDTPNVNVTVPNAGQQPVAQPERTNVNLTVPSTGQQPTGGTTVNVTPSQSSTTTQPDTSSGELVTPTQPQGQGTTGNTLGTTGSTTPANSNTGTGNP